MNLKDAHNQFIRECQNGTLKRKADTTIRNYKETFRLFESRFPGMCTTDLTEGVVRMFFQWGEKHRNWKPWSVMSHRQRLSVFFKWCMLRNFLKQNPLSNIPLPVIPEKFPDSYSEEDVQKVFYTIEMNSYSDFLRIRNRAMFAMILLAGLRKSEVIKLKVGDIDFKDGFIRVRPETAKNRAPRALPMSAKLKELLLAYWNVRESAGIQLFSFWASSQHGKTFTEHGWKHLVQKVSNESGVKFQAQKGRRTFATHTYKQSGDIVGLSRLLGHKDIKTTMIYAASMPEHARATIESNSLNNLL